MSNQDATEIQDQTLGRFVNVDSGWVVVNAAGKLNLTLEVGALRADQYHQFTSLICTISLYDQLEISLTDKPGIVLTCDNPAVPEDNQNLVYQAAELLASAAGIEPQLRIKLIKGIAVQAGLGGGSSDAAAALLALNRLWDLNWPGDRLARLGEQLGSDVPFFLFGPLAICSGRGQEVQALDFRWDFWAVIVKDRTALSTRDVYQQYRPGKDQSMGRSADLAGKLAHLSPGQVGPMLFNALEPAAFKLAGQLKDLQRRLEQLTSSTVRLCGSGSALFALFDTAEQAEAMHHLAKEYPDLEAWVVTNNLW